MPNSVLLSGGNTGQPLNWRNFPCSMGSGADLRLGGSHIGPPSLVTNPWGGTVGLNAYSFQGQLASSGSNVWDLSQYNVTGWTVEFRIQRLNINMGSQQIIMSRWGNGNSNTGFNQQFNVQWESNNKIEVQVNNLSNSTTSLASASAITDTLSHDIAFAFTGTSGTSKLYFFVDGSLINAGGTAFTGALVGPTASFMLGNWMNQNQPLFAIIGEVIVSNTARNTATYSVRTTPYSPDAHTVAYLKMDSLHGTWLGAPTYLGNIATYTGFSGTFANGGFGNPDGYYPTLKVDGAGKVFGTLGTYSTTTTNWTLFPYIASSLKQLFAGGGTFGSTSIQNPATTPVNQGDIAGNGSVIPWMNAYYNLYCDANGRAWVSKNANLSTAFPTGTQIYAATGISPYTQLFDLKARPSLDGSKIEWFLCGQISGGDRALIYTSCPFGSDPTVAANWQTPVVLLAHLEQGPTFGSYAEWSYTRWPYGTAFLGSGDGGLLSSGGLRLIGGYWSPDGTTVVQSGGLLDPVGVQGSSKYIACYDSDLTWDFAGEYGQGRPGLWLTFSNGTNNSATQPTNADWGVAFFPLVGDTWPAYTPPTFQTFTTGGTYTPATNGFATMYIIAGGGAGGTSTSTEAGGGGGGGEVLWSHSVPVVGSTNYTVTVGAGGTTGAGGNSSVIGGAVSLTATGGGAGGLAGAAGGNGGSGGGGGGGSGSTVAGGTGVGVQLFGQNGGTGSTTGGGGGGGGANSTGSNSSGTAGGAGGAGSVYIFGGARGPFGGGGGGGSGGGAAGAAGSGGGGAGGASGAAGTAGTANTGGGGGGAGINNATQAAGGSGIVIILGP